MELEENETMFAGGKYIQYLELEVGEIIIAGDRRLGIRLG